MRFILLLASAAIAASSLISGVSFASEVGPKLEPMVAPTLVPIGSSPAGNTNYSVAWMLDTANSRVMSCFANRAGPDCKLFALPKSNYIPIGSSAVGNTNYSAAWMLDTANGRVTSCLADTAGIDCKSIDLPK